MKSSLRISYTALFSSALFLLTPVLFFLGELPAEAATPRQLVKDSLRNLTSHTAQLVQQVQLFLQQSGRWAPTQAADIQLCKILQTFEKTVARINSDNNGRPYQQVQSDYQQLQLQSQNLEQQINLVAQNLLVAQAWMQVRNDIVSVNQNLNSASGFNPGNFYDAELGLNQGMGGTSFQPGIPGSGFTPFSNGGPQYYPGYRPTNINITENSTFDSNPSFQGSFSNMNRPFPAVMPGMVPGGMVPGNTMPGANNAHLSQAISNISSAENQTDRFVKQLTKFLQMRGKWMPAQGSPEMLLCQNLQSFQQQLRKLSSDLQSNIAFPVLQSEMQQIGSSSQSIDQLLMQTGATPDVIARWNEVRTSMNSAYQGFYSSGNGYYWMR